MTTTLPRRPGSEPEADRSRRPRLTIALVIAAIVVVLAGGTWAVAFSSLLGAKTITVTGVHTLTADQVRTTARIPAGAALIRLDQGAVTRRVESLPEVATARVRLRYPNTVVITVTERVAVGYVTDGSGFGLVDHDGRQFRTVATTPPALPHFIFPAGKQSEPTGAAIASVAAALSGTPVLVQLTSIQAMTPDDLVLLLRDGRTVTWGSADRNADKARVLPALLAQPGRAFDVTNPDQVVAR